MSEGFEFTALGRVLLDWPVGSSALTFPAATPLPGRIQQVLRQALPRGVPVHAPDLMVLARQLLS